MASNKRSSINLGLPPSPETTNAEILPEMIRIYNAINILSEATDTYTGSVVPESNLWSSIPYAESYRSQNSDVLFIKAFEDIPYGAVCNLSNNSGELVASLSDATDGTKPCKAINTGGDITAGDTGRFNLAGALVSVFSGLTIGATYYLATTPGLVTAVAPTISGNVVQTLGYALSPTQLMFLPVFAATYEVVP